MAHPKRKTSKARSAKRRAQYKVQTLPTTRECPSCGAPKLMHRACPTCGEYRGRSVRADRELV